MRHKAIITGAGFAGLASATILAKNGYDVTVFEKNEQAGGRARTLQAEGFIFDMGPSWYWMPDVFERYFELFGKSTRDFYELKLLDPAFTVFFGKDDKLQVPASTEEIYQLFEREEKNSAHKLRRFLEEAALKYKLAMSELVYLPAGSLLEFIQPSILLNLPRISLFTSFHAHARRFFTSERLLKLVEFPILFLGATSKETPALFSLMNHAAFNLSTWYPMGGFSKVTDGMLSIADEHRVTIKMGEAVTGFTINDSRVKTVCTTKGLYSCDAVIGASDYAHTEDLLGKRHRNYSSSYWNNKTFAPSALIFYLGVNKKLEQLTHHNLFFDEDFAKHAEEIYGHKQWPTKPLFYICCTSKTDPSTAPEGHENVFILMPLAPALHDDDATREKYFNIITSRIEKITGERIVDNIVYKKSYCIKDFVSDYNACNGNAYGLANTLKQTAIFRPAIRNKKVRNFFYCGQLTVPGSGVPPAIISGEIAARQLMKRARA